MVLAAHCRSRHQRMMMTMAMAILYSSTCIVDPDAIILFSKKAFLDSTSVLCIFYMLGSIPLIMTIRVKITLLYECFKQYEQAWQFRCSAPWCFHNIVRTDSTISEALEMYHTRLLFQIVVLVAEG